MHTTTAALTDQRRRISTILEKRCELSDVVGLSASYTNSHKLRRVIHGLDPRIHRSSHWLIRVTRAVRLPCGNLAGSIKAIRSRAPLRADRAKAIDGRSEAH